MDTGSILPAVGMYPHGNKWSWSHLGRGWIHPLSLTGSRAVTEEHLATDKLAAQY